MIANRIYITAVHPKASDSLRKRETAKKIGSLENETERTLKLQEANG